MASVLQFQHNLVTNIYASSKKRLCALLIIAVGLIPSVSQSQPAGSVVLMREYFPLKPGSYWAYSWANVRGDRWSGSMAVLSQTGKTGDAAFIVADTLYEGMGKDISRSAYRWDADGLKHLYRVTDDGDSTVFEPARMVLPSKLDPSQPLSYKYKYAIYNKNKKVKIQGEVLQQFKIINRDPVATQYSQWKDCAAVEITRTDKFGDGSTIQHQGVVYYARNVGIVKIVNELTPAVGPISGAETGLLLISR